LFEQLDYFDHFIQVDALDRAYDVRFVAFWKILSRGVPIHGRLIADLNTVVSLDNRHNIDETLENFRAASENLRELTASVKQRPWALLRGKPAPDRPVPVVTGAH
jgi:hypothetical protein